MAPRTSCRHHGNYLSSVNKNRDRVITDSVAFRCSTVKDKGRSRLVFAEVQDSYMYIPAMSCKDSVSAKGVQLFNF